MPKKIKLVRDLIPNIIQKTEGVVFYTASEEEYEIALKEKLYEEIEEFYQDRTIEEMADILEVLEAIMIFYKHKKLDIIAAKDKKQKEKGAFLRKTMLQIESDAHKMNSKTN